MAKPQKKVLVRKLGVGAVFGFVATGSGEPVNQMWKIIGRPTYSGQKIEGKKEYIVPCIYVKTSKDDQNVQPDKSFSIDLEVVEIRPGQKDFQAIDQRDQPTDSKGRPVVTPLGALVKDLKTAGIEDVPDEEDGDGSLESFIKDDEEEEVDDED